jgi:hypothetical protein
VAAPAATHRNRPSGERRGHADPDMSMPCTCASLTTGGKEGGATAASALATTDSSSSCHSSCRSRQLICRREGMSMGCCASTHRTDAQAKRCVSDSGRQCRHTVTGRGACHRGLHTECNSKRAPPMLPLPPLPSRPLLVSLCDVAPALSRWGQEAGHREGEYGPLPVRFSPLFFLLLLSSVSCSSPVYVSCVCCCLCQRGTAPRGNGRERVTLHGTSQRARARRGRDGRGRSAAQTQRRPPTPQTARQDDTTHTQHPMHSRGYPPFCFCCVCGYGSFWGRSVGR